MDLYFVFSSLDTLLANREFKQQIIQYIWGLYDYKIIPIEHIDNNDYIIGKITSMDKLPEVYNFICYLMNIVNNTIDTIYNKDNDIICIHNLYIILNSEYKNNFISFLKGVLYDKIEHWGEFEKNENCYIIGRLIDIKYEPVFKRVNYMIMRQQSHSEPQIDHNGMHTESIENR
jgi:hypothetical protein